MRSAYIGQHRQVVRPIILTILIDKRVRAGDVWSNGAFGFVADEFEV